MKTNTKLKPVATIESLTRAWLAAREAERAANGERIEIEQQLAALMPCPQGVEGTRTESVGEYRVAVRYTVTTKVDTEKLQALWADLPEAAHKAFRWKAEVDKKALTGLREFAPADYARIVPTLETKAAKPSVSVESIERNA